MSDREGQSGNQRSAEQEHRSQVGGHCVHQVAMVAGFADRVLGLRRGKVVLDIPGAEFNERHHQAVYDTGAGR